MIKTIVDAILEKKGQDVAVLDFSKQNAMFFTHFIICHGSSNPQIEAIAENVDRMVRKKKKIHPIHIEGKNNMEWVLIDYGDIIVHVFKEESRKFYNLEDLWADAVIQRFDQ